jgi:hypothetical protein
VSLVFADGALYALLTADIAKVFSEEPSGAEIRISHRHDVHWIELGKSSLQRVTNNQPYNILQIIRSNSQLSFMCK